MEKIIWPDKFDLKGLNVKGDRFVIDIIIFRKI